MENKSSVVINPDKIILFHGTESIEGLIGIFNEGFRQIDSHYCASSGYEGDKVNKFYKQDFFIDGLYQIILDKDDSNLQIENAFNRDAYNELLDLKNPYITTKNKIKNKRTWKEEYLSKMQGHQITNHAFKREREDCKKKQ